MKFLMYVVLCLVVLIGLVFVYFYLLKGDLELKVYFKVLVVEFVVMCYEVISLVVGDVVFVVGCFEVRYFEFIC